MAVEASSFFVLKDGELDPAEAPPLTKPPVGDTGGDGDDDAPSAAPLEVNAGAALPPLLVECQYVGPPPPVVNDEERGATAGSVGSKGSSRKGNKGGARGGGSQEMLRLGGTENNLSCR